MKLKYLFIVLIVTAIACDESSEEERFDCIDGDCIVGGVTYSSYSDCRNQCGSTSGEGEQPEENEFTLYFTLFYTYCPTNACACTGGNYYTTGERLRIKIYKSGANVGNDCESYCGNTEGIVFNELIFEPYSQEDRFGDDSGYVNLCNTNGNYLHEKFILDADEYSYCYEVSISGTVVESGSVSGNQTEPGDCLTRNLNPFNEI